MCCQRILYTDIYGELCISPVVEIWEDTILNPLKDFTVYPALVFEADDGDKTALPMANREEVRAILYSFLKSGYADASSSEGNLDYDDLCVYREGTDSMEEILEKAKHLWENAGNNDEEDDEDD